MTGLLLFGELKVVLSVSGIFSSILVSFCGELWLYIQYRSLQMYCSTQHVVDPVHQQDTEVLASWVPSKGPAPQPLTDLLPLQYRRVLCSAHLLCFFSRINMAVTTRSAASKQQAAPGQEGKDEQTELWPRDLAMIFLILVVSLLSLILFVVAMLWLVLVWLAWQTRGRFAC